jgi:O-acetyl-ADP-ribose deacetylase (regulator of RNase III)
MIEAVRKGDLFQSSAQTLVNTVNTVGVMGKGIALEFKRRFPEMFADYQRRCEAGEVRLGKPYLWRGLVEPWVINFPTKGHWRSVSRLADIERGLAYLADHVAEWGVISLAVPPLGAGSGGLDWATVGPTIYRHLDRLPIPVALYAPFEAPDEQASVEFLAAQAPRVNSPSSGRLEPGWIALAEIVRRVGTSPHAWPVGRTRLQKLAYFATAAGVPTGLRFTEASYGPYADELKPALTRLVNNGVLIERKIGRMLAVQPGPSFADAAARYQARIRPHEQAVQRVTDLLARLDSDETELAASVHFAATALRSELGRAPSEREVLHKIQHWKRRRVPPLNDRDVVAAIRDLAALGWIEVTATDLPPGDAASVA